MKIFKINIRFILSKSKVKKDGKAPLLCRATLKDRRKQFYTGLFIKPENWNSSLQMGKPPNEENQFINTQLSLIRNKVNQAFLLLQMQGEDFDVEDVYLRYKGKATQREGTLLEVFDIHNERLGKLVGIEYSKYTFAKFKETRKHLHSFMRKQYNKQDMMLKDLSIKFLTDLDFYFKTERQHRQSTTNKHIHRLRKIINIAIGEGFLDCDTTQIPVEKIGLYKHPYRTCSTRRCPKIINIRKNLVQI